MKGTSNKIIIQKEGFLNWLTAGLPLMKVVLTTLTENVLVPLGLTASVSATDAAIYKNIFGLGTTALIISNKEMEGI